MSTHEFKNLKEFVVDYKKVNNREKEIAKLLSKGNIVAVCNGKMEFGERALGNRSILADPRKVETKNKINAAVYT